MKGRGRLFGEFVLIVLGVLMALTVDTWVDQWNDRSLRSEYIARLMADLELDLQGLDLRIEFFTDVSRRGQETLDWLQSEQPPNTDILVGAFYSSEMYGFQPIASTYNDLQNTGNIGLLDDLDLRRELGAYYALAVARQPGWNTPRSYRDIARSVIPPKVQTQIRESCPAEVLGRSTGLAQCELPGAETRDIAVALTKLRSDPATVRALSLLIGEVDVSILLYGQQADEARALIERLSSEPGGSV